MENGLAKSIEPFFEKVGKLSKIQRIAISAVLFGLIAGAFVYFSYWPKFERINKFNSDLKELKKKLEVAKRNSKDLKEFQAKMKEAETQFLIAMKKLPEKEEIPSLLASISNSGQQSGLEFLLFEPKPEIRREFYAEIPVAMSIKGDYHNMAAFFDQVARLSRIVNIKNIQMGGFKGKDSSDLNAKCMAVTYKFVEAPPPKKKAVKKKKPKKKSKKKKRH